MSSEHLCLKWNNFESNIANYLDVLRSENDFVDVTITCGGANFKAHKVILSACSPYFKAIFQENPCPHPVIILKNVSAQEMDAILRYIYTGQTFVTEESLLSFLNTANLLQIIGLANYGLSNGTNGTVEARPSVLVKKFGKRRSESETDEETPRKVDRERPPACKERPRTPTNNTPKETPKDANKDENCPILSTRLMLPKKRKVSVIDQNKNVQLVSEGSEGSNSSGEGGILRGVLAEKPDPTPDKLELGIKTEPIDEDRLLEPEVGLSIKDESDFDSASEESLPNGDILLNRLQGTSHDESSDETGILRVPNPDVSIFSKTLAKNDSDPERLTLTPNVEIFLKNSSGCAENLLQKLSSINVFSNSSTTIKPIKLTKKPRIGPSPGTSKVEKDGTASCEARTLHLTNLPCPHCRQLYNNLSALKYHVRLMHSDLENKLFCYLCPMSFIEREYFKIHLWESHNARF